VPHSDVSASPSTWDGDRSDCRNFTAARPSTLSQSCCPSTKEQTHARSHSDQVGGRRRSRRRHPRSRRGVPHPSRTHHRREAGLRVPRRAVPLVDTRPGSPIGPAGDAAALPVQITGENGNCTGPLAIPADAVGVSTNVTAIHPTPRRADAPTSPSTPPAPPRPSPRTSTSSTVKHPHPTRSTSASAPVARSRSTTTKAPPTPPSTSSATTSTTVTPAPTSSTSP
jgi:hypothetical protein